MRISDEVLKSVGFIGEVTGTDPDGKDSEDLHATGFFVAVPALSPELLGKVTFYFVTAKHVAKDLEGRTIYFLVNKLGGGVAPLKSDYGCEWWFHPTDATADIALIRVSFKNDMDIKAIPMSWISTKESLAERGIGIGDEILMTGLFTPAAGIGRNMPIVRHGNIAMMPEEQIQTELGYADVYLVEARSLGGLSGSPVFVRPTISTPIAENPYGLKNAFSFGHASTLLGLMHGHWDIKESDMNESFLTHDRKHGVNYGVAIVVPAYKIVETLNRPELVEIRKKSEEVLVGQMIPGMD